MKIFFDKILRFFYFLEDFFFEKKLQLDLNASFRLNFFKKNNNKILSNNSYQPVWTRNLRVLFGNAFKLGVKFENFIDLGSGKGKACFFANQKKYFKNIYGVEISKELIIIANNNKKKFLTNNIEFIQIDASRYILPNKNNLIFMFNPFNNIILEKFIINNLNHFKKYNSVIMYSNDVCRMLLLKYRFISIFREDTRKISIYKYLK